ncbi:stage V sporulation protein B [Eubacterium sp. 14-2]|uniref:polysaccharide biosynthesis protein n=1 Tax=Eubacterium sp. 14-2 TaxID=1235790 RepID=UPI00033EEDEC|nr:polysaccharide biosynthesis protein [Eubacterium sp. 14-2]EOT26855.1 stage V sporulation protein B [Eubacterium sp. 14-2]
MNFKSLRSHPLITGTLLLTLSGLLSRLIGFFYRIFLSQRIGAEGMGIYQLTFPIHILTISLTSSAIQTAISRFVAQAASSGCNRDKGSSFCRKSFHNEKCYLTAGLMLSLSLAFACTIFLYRFSNRIATEFLEEPRCAPLLQILSLTIPFAAIHSCINGYFYGLKKTFVPAASQLLEQFVRVAGVWLFFEISMEKHGAISLNLVMWGMVAGELAAVLFSVSFLRRKKNQGSRLGAMRQIFFMSLPLSANRVLVNILQSMEAVMIPGQLRQFGYSTSESLSVYGILTGMALPMVLFPSVLTNSVSVMLLPAIAEAQEKKEHGYILTLIKRTCFYSLLLGFGCTMMFLFLGRWMGSFLFGNELAGTFIVILGWICPFLYLSTTLHSILNGLGKTTSTFFLNIMGLGIRIGFVLYVIPAAGIKGYLWGLLLSQSVMASGALFLLLRRK